MMRRLRGVGLLLVAASWFSGAESDIAVAAPIENAVTVFPSVLDIDARRGETIERTLGIDTSGDSFDTVVFEISGDAADIVEVMGDGESVDQVAAADEVTYVTVRVAVPGTMSEGVAGATIRIIAQGGEVRAGTTVDVDVDVEGQVEDGIDLVEVSALDRVTMGRPFHVDVTLDVAGNDSVEPEIVLTVAGPGGDLERRAFPPATQSGEARTARASWSTADWVVGRYDGEVGVWADTVRLGGQAVSFEVVAPDEALRAVEVFGADVVSRLEVGAVAKIEITVRNVGATDGRAVYAGEVWRDDERLDPVRSDAILLESGQMASIAVYVPTEVAGTYRIRGNVDLDGAKSSTFALPFVVDPIPSGRSIDWVTAVIVIVISATVGGGMFALRRKARRRA